MKRYFLFLLVLSALPMFRVEAQLQLDEKGYFHTRGLDVTVFSDYYPDGHQSGVTIIQHGNRVAANGDLRLEPSPGQWSPVPKEGERVVDLDKQQISQTLWFPDSSKNLKGFNPIVYPRLRFKYQVHVSALPGNSVKVVVDLERPLPEEWIGKVGFNLELFPGDLFGKSYQMGEDFGLFPDQPHGNINLEYGEALAEPLAIGSKLVVAPEDKLQRMVIRSNQAKLELWDGRTNHNNGWFIVRSKVPVNVTKGAIEWIISPSVVYGWEYAPVIQVSQLGYHPNQHKKAVVELDPEAAVEDEFKLFRLGEHGREHCFTGRPSRWGPFLRYQYATLDFSQISEPGMYQLS